MNELMTKAVLQITNDLGEIKGDTRAIKEKVDSHDTLLKEHGDMLTEINKRTFNLDSWKNGIIHTVTEEKEKALAQIRAEMKPVKDDFDTRQKGNEEKKQEFTKIKYNITGNVIEKGVYLCIAMVATNYKAIINFITKLFS